VPVTALVLALASAALHAVWNVLLASARDSEAATAVALVVATIAFAPVAVATWDVEREAWPYVGASAGLELAYFALLGAAYGRAPLGLVYPLARGLAPVLVLLAAAVALGAHPTRAEAAGVVVIGVGVALVRGLGRRADRVGTAFALAIAACIAAYTLVDKEGMEHAAPLPYLEVVLAGPAVVYASAVVARRGIAPVRAEMRPPVAVAGLAMFAAFGLALAALARGPAAPVAAVRETSVVLAAALAVLVLGERLTVARLAGAALVAAGVAVLALA
jgi:drug/metabolite transporter (DMT)-like permease